MGDNNSRDDEIKNIILDFIKDVELNDKTKNDIINFKLDSIQKQVTNINDTLLNLTDRFGILENSGYYRKKTYQK